MELLSRAARAHPRSTRTSCTYAPAAGATVYCLLLRLHHTPGSFSQMRTSPQDRSYCRSAGRRGCQCACESLSSCSGRKISHIVPCFVFFFIVQDLFLENAAWILAHINLSLQHLQSVTSEVVLEYITINQ